jgi:ribosome-associated toxin RatA of RatAB toxin-antitoxin module
MANRVFASARIPLPIETCWEKFRDLTRATDYVPGLTNTVITSENKEGVGASRIVSHSQFGDMNETVTVWDEGVGMTIRLHKGDGPAKPFKEAEFRYEFRPSADSTEACEIHTSLSYVLPGGAIGRLLDRLFLSRVFRGNVVDTAVCLAENYQTDQPIDPTRLKALRATAL